MNNRSTYDGKEKTEEKSRPFRDFQNMYSAHNVVLL